MTFFSYCSTRSALRFCLPSTVIPPPLVFTAMPYLVSSYSLQPASPLLTILFQVAGALAYTMGLYLFHHRAWHSEVLVVPRTTCSSLRTTRMRTTCSSCELHACRGMHRDPRILLP
jgi:hypothetical protein